MITESAVIKALWAEGGQYWGSKQNGVMVHATDYHIMCQNICFTDKRPELVQETSGTMFFKARSIFLISKVFYGEFESEKRKRQKNFDLPEREFEPQIFSNSPVHDLNFHVKSGA